MKLKTVPPISSGKVFKRNLKGTLLGLSITGKKYSQKPIVTITFNNKPTLFISNSPSFLAAFYLIRYLAPSNLPTKFRLLFE
jgi:hypothetical protein